MTDRERLVEVMARGFAERYLWNWEFVLDSVKDSFLLQAEAALAAAERAGFEFCRKESEGE